jgi:hypothetical protein
MDPILRRSSLFYVTTMITYVGLLGRFMLTRDWPVFEVIPLFLPVWLLSGMAASELNERYAFLRMLPVPDRTVARKKFILVGSFTAVAWAFMTGVSLVRLGDGLAGPATLVYITLVCVLAMLAGACYQVGIWRFGLPVMLPVILVSVAAGLVLCLVHTANLKNVDDWPALSRLPVVEWLGGAPWMSSAVIIAMALLAFRVLMEAGVRVKAASEAHL